MKFSISKEILEKYPEVKIGVVVATGIDNSGDDPQIGKLLASVQEEARRLDITRLAEHPVISKWRQVYSSFGSKPSDYRCSVEALVRSVLNGREIRHINKLVDLYNYISLKYIIPVGGEDLDEIEAGIFLRHAEGHEIFIPLGSAAAESPYKGEVIYCDSAGDVLCRRWNWRESDKTKLTEETRNAVIVLEGFDENVEAATRELAGLVEKFCGAATQVFIIDKNSSEIEF